MTIPSDDEVRDAMMKVPARVAEILAEGNKERYKFVYGLMLMEVTEACRVLGKPAEDTNGRC